MNSSAIGAFTWRDVVGAGDMAHVREIVTRTGFFTPAEVAIAEELVSERLEKGAASGYEFLFAEHSGEILGYSCYGLTPGTDHSFDLYWIVVVPGAQRKGLGRAMLERVEPIILNAGGKVIWADTSSSVKYAPTRAFYERSGFRRAALLDDFYRSGDAKVIYEKRIGGA